MGYRRTTAKLFSRMWAQAAVSVEVTGAVTVSTRFAVLKTVPTHLCRRIRNLASAAALDAGWRGAHRCQVRSALVLAVLALVTLQSAWLHCGIDQWTSSGPGQAAVIDVFADPSRPDRVIALTPWRWPYYTTAMITSDAGNTWSELGLRVYFLEVASIVFDPHDERIIFALLVGADAIYMEAVPPTPILWRTTDGGLTWSQCAEGVIGIIASQSTPGLFYAPAKDRMYTSANGGLSWSPVEPGGYWPPTASSQPEVHPYRMAVSGDETETIWMAGESGLYRSINRGRTWIAAGPAEKKITLLTVAGPARDVVLAGDGTTLWRSTDRGDSWTDTNLPHVIACAVNSMNSSELYCVDGLHNLFRSADAGLTWETLLIDPADAIVDVTVSPGNLPTVFAHSWWGPLVRWEPDGAWKVLDLGVHGLAFRLAVDPETDARLYAVADARPNSKRCFFRSDNAGMSWTAVGPANFSGSYLAVAPGSSGAIYASAGVIIYKSTDQGGSWERILEGHGLKDVQVAPNAPEIVYVGKSADDLYDDPDTGVYRSTDAGAHWTLLKNGLPGGVYRLAIDAGDSQRLLAATSSGLFRSDDGGDSWSPVPQFAGSPISSVAFHPRQPGVAFAAAGAPLFRSDDAGLTWSPLADLGERISWIRFDPASGETLYLVTSLDELNGAYFDRLYDSTFLYRGSALTGGPWARFAPAQGGIYDLVVSGAEPTTVHVSTSRGVYSLTSVSEELSDFEIVQARPRELIPGADASLTLRVTNHGPADFSGTVKVETWLSQSPDCVTVGESPGWRPQWFTSDLGDHVTFVHDGLFPAGETKTIHLGYPHPHRAPITVVTPSRPVDRNDSSNVTTEVEIEKTSADRESRPRSRPRTRR
jgi:photosystem II stability/assembly factor-like uncharacterized protein